jgi:hypothetical protein
MEARRTLPKGRPAGRGAGCADMEHLPRPTAHLRPPPSDSTLFRMEARARVQIAIDLHARGSPDLDQARTKQHSDAGRACLCAPPTGEDLSGSPHQGVAATVVPRGRPGSAPGSPPHRGGWGAFGSCNIGSPLRPFECRPGAFRPSRTLGRGEAHVVRPAPRETTHLSQDQFDR